MQVTRVASFRELQQFAPSWNALTRGIPMRSWEWLSTWWEHYGTDGQLYVLVVHDESHQFVGALPLYRSQNAFQGRALHFLGSGEVCNDYGTVLTSTETEPQVVEAIAGWLLDSCQQEADQWDLIELDGVLKNDSAVQALSNTLNQAGCELSHLPSDSSWQAPLPTSWEEMYAGYSKNRRKVIRRINRTAVEEGGAIYQTVQSFDELNQQLDLLIDLHQKRRSSLGEAGCFASDRFENFLRDASSKLFATNQLELGWVELNDQVVAMEYNLIGAETAYGFQSGLDPQAIDASPGHVMALLSLQHSIECGRQAYDFLRGDEPYKAHWAKESQEMIKLRISANRSIAQIRHSAWVAGVTMKGWIKDGLTMVGIQ